MSNSSERSWFDNPNAPQISPRLYLSEKTNLAGIVIGAISHGITTVLFFQCMSALLNSRTDRKGDIKWALVAHTAAMFSLATIATATNLELQSVSSVDNREFPGPDGTQPSGPLAYQFFVIYDVLNVIPGVIFFLNQWLADGLLLYRCCVIYAMNYWVIALPSLMYLASIALGITLAYQSSQPDSALRNSQVIDFGSPYYSISLSLNLLLTFMIVMRLALHSRDIRGALGPLVRPDRLYKAIITILVESSALYAVAFVLFIGSWRATSPAQYIFLPILSETQVIAPFLITLRLAKRTALTNDTIVSGDLGSIHFVSQRDSEGSDGSLRPGAPTSPVDGHGETSSGELGVGTDNTIEEVTL